MDLPFWLIAGLGFALGLAHALDPDHMVAVSTLVSRSSSLAKSAAAGAFWGIGHTITLLAVGLLVLLLGITIPPAAASYFKFLAGMTLVLLGVSVVVQYRRQKAHFHHHYHEEELQSHFHLHFHKETEDHREQHHGERRRPLLVGMVQGLAGSAAFMLIVLTTTPTAWLGLLYIVVFGLGTVLGMVVTTLLIGSTLTYLAQRIPAVHSKVQILIGIASIVAGTIISTGIILAL